MARHPSRPARFLPGESLSRGLGRLLPEIAWRAEAVTHPDVPAEESIHALRLLVKQTRALSWLVEPELSSKTSRKIMKALRDVANPLGHTRDQSMVISTIHKIVRRLPVAHRPGTLDGLKDVLNRDANKESDPTALIQSALHQFQDALDDMTPRLLKAAQELKLKKRLRKAYAALHKTGKKALRPAAAEECVHDWRKVAKRFYYLLPEPDSKVTGNRLEQVRELQRFLGDYHDGTVARNAVGDHRSDVWKCAWEEHQQDLLARARKLFRKLPRTIPFT